MRGEVYLPPWSPPPWGPRRRSAKNIVFIAFRQKGSQNEWGFLGGVLRGCLLWSILGKLGRAESFGDLWGALGELCGGLGGGLWGLPAASSGVMHAALGGLCQSPADHWRPLAAFGGL